MTTDQLMTTAEVVAEYPFFKPSTLRFWRSSDVGPVSFRVGGRVLYRRSELERWIAEQEAASLRGGTSDPGR